MLQKAVLIDRTVRYQFLLLLHVFFFLCTVSCGYVGSQFFLLFFSQDLYENLLCTVDTVFLSKIKFYVSIYLRWLSVVACWLNG